MKRRRTETILRLIAKLMAWFGALLTLAGGVAAIVGSALPWAKAELFGSMEVSLPGIAFVLGSVAAACGAASLFLMRFPLLIVLIGLILFVDTALAVQQIPRAVRGELIDAQKGFFPINEMLDKFGIDTVTVGNYGAKDGEYIGAGVQWAMIGGSLIFVGGLMALPRDTWLRKAGRRFIMDKCNGCGCAWPLGREALYCPNCSAPTYRADEICKRCSGPLLPKDHYCIKCGYPRGT